MSKLILFIHGLGGDKETWGNFETIIQEDTSFDSSYKVEFYEYNTALLIAKGILPHLGWGGKLLSLVFKDKPKIQDVARLLRSDIDHEYSGYEDIYLVVHSMGGLVALKYLVDELNHEKPIKIKKLLLYDVPHRGSHLAKISSVYKHTQVLQLDKSSDFLDALTNAHEFKTIEDRLEVKCMSCQDGVVVDKASAQAHYKNVYELERTHTSIVKPENRKDIVYRAFREFMVEKGDDAFIERIFNNLSNEIFVLLHQKHTHIAPQVATIQSKSAKLFKEHFYHFVTPDTSKTKYYEKLGKLIGAEIKNATEFEEAMGR
ncbi:MAG: alpha/beta hydrolase [Epsilonproteobacteria bacterium]|nr:alpha/beta hydrolase [Campylobacterota bacterium]